MGKISDTKSCPVYNGDNKHSSRWSKCWILKSMWSSWHKFKNKQIPFWDYSLFPGYIKDSFKNEPSRINYLKDASGSKCNLKEIIHLFVDWIWFNTMSGWICKVSVPVCSCKIPKQEGDMTWRNMYYKGLTK